MCAHMNKHIPTIYARVLVCQNSPAKSKHSKLRWIVKALVKRWEGFEQNEASMDQEEDPKVSADPLCCVKEIAFDLCFCLICMHWFQFFHYICLLFSKKERYRKLNETLHHAGGEGDEKCSGANAVPPPSVCD